MPRLMPIADHTNPVYPNFMITTDHVLPDGPARTSNIVGMHVSASNVQMRIFDANFGTASTMIMSSTDMDSMPFRISLNVLNSKQFTTASQSYDDITSMLYLSPNFQMDPYLIESFEIDQEKSMMKRTTRPPELQHYVMAESDEDLREAIWNRLQSYACPLLPEWKDTLIELLYENEMISPLYVQYFNYHTDSPVQAVRILASQHGLELLISDAIRNYQLPFALDAMGDTSAFDELNTLPNYINHFAADLAQAVQDNINVLFDPSRGDTFSPAFMDLNTHANRQGLTGMFVPQAGAVSAISETIDKEGFAFVCGEMGVGKTVISASAPYVHARSKGHDGYRAIVLSPNIMMDKWKREIMERVPNAEVHMIKSFHDLTTLDRTAGRPTRPTYFIIAQTTFKMSYPKEPIRIRRIGMNSAPTDRFNLVPYNRSEREAGRPTLKMVREVFEGITFPDDDSFHCPQCDRSWGDAPFGRSLTKPSKASMNKQCSCGQPYWGTTKLDSKSKNRKVSPAWYINKFFPRGYFEYLLVDEAHEYKSGSTDIGRALGQLVNHTTYQMLMTGTLFGGKAIDLFYLVARLKPRKLFQEGMDYNSKTHFHNRYGVTQMREVLNQTTEKAERRRVDRPGINPSLYPMYLMGNAVFLDLSDLGYALPPYEELPEIVGLDPILRAVYEDAMNAVRDFHDSNKDSESFRELHPSYTAATLLHQVNAMLDRPYAKGRIAIFDKFGRETLVYHNEQITRDYRPAKYRRLLDMIQEEKAAGRKVLVYAKDVDTNNPHNGLDLWLKDALEEDGISTGLLRSAGKDSDGDAYPSGPDREKWLKKKQQMHDWDVLVVNPSLVKVGLDMLEYKTIVFYQFGLSAFEYMQASRRSWRIRQDKEIRVLTLAYGNTPQQYYLELLATKIDAALTIQGKMSDEGMRSMAESSSDLNELAKNIMNGDQLSSIETVHDRFRNLNQTYDQLTRSEMVTYDSYSQNPDIDSLERVLKGEPLDIIDVVEEEPVIELHPDPVLLTQEEAKEIASRPPSPPVPVASIPRKRRNDMDLFKDLIKVEKIVERKKNGSVEVAQYALDI